MIDGMRPYCPNGHEMEPKAIYGYGEDYVAVCVCKCGWRSPKRIGPTREAAKRRAILAALGMDVKVEEGA